MMMQQNASTIQKMESFYGYVRDVSEALVLFEASRIGLIPLITSRLSETTRCYIRPGSIFIWEIGVGGMRRWTDGHTWSPSRYSNFFFLYHELDTDLEPTENKSEIYKQNGLLKRTNSISTTDGRKFQLVNYVYNDAEKNCLLPSISSYPIATNVIIPINYYYRPKNTLKKRKDSSDSNTDNNSNNTYSHPNNSMHIIPYQTNSFYLNNT